jgi:beta-lysine N6-acetyltransferase
MPSTIQISKKKLLLAAHHGEAEVCDDAHSDRLRCDHPIGADPHWLAETLIKEAELRGRGKVLSLVEERMIPSMQKVGFRVAAFLPGFYGGKSACGVLTHNVDISRLELANPREVKRVHGLLKNIEGSSDIHRLRAESVKTELMDELSASDLARLMGVTFKDYPTPSHDPAYLLSQVNAGVPFRYIRNGDEVVACASADIVPQAQAAELTDCATLARCRGRGYMKVLLIDLMDDLRRMSYPTAFTMARARIPGINILFKQLGFKFCGQLSRSCRIGEGLEDINLWSRRL